MKTGLIRLLGIRPLGGLVASANQLVHQIHLQLLIANVGIAGGVFRFAQAIELVLGRAGIRTVSKIASLILAAIGERRQMEDPLGVLADNSMATPARLPNGRLRRLCRGVSSQPSRLGPALRAVLPRTDCCPQRTRLESSAPAAATCSVSLART